jgi:hypothetical protein
VMHLYTSLVVSLLFCTVFSTCSHLCLLQPTSTSSTSVPSSSPTTGYVTHAFDCYTMSNILLLTVICCLC